MTAKQRIWHIIGFIFGVLIKVDGKTVGRYKREPDYVYGSDGTTVQGIRSATLEPFWERRS
jgi:hypothetical protein